MLYEDKKSIIETNAMKLLDFIEREGYLKDFIECVQSTNLSGMASLSQWYFRKVIIDQLIAENLIQEAK